MRRDRYGTVLLSHLSSDLSLIPDLSLISDLFIRILQQPRVVLARRYAHASAQLSRLAIRRRIQTLLQRGGTSIGHGARVVIGTM